MDYLSKQIIILIFLCDYLGMFNDYKIHIKIQTVYSVFLHFVLELIFNSEPGLIPKTRWV